jgi:hypothetical protein
MNLKDALNHSRRANTRESTFRGDAKFVEMSLRYGHALVQSIDPVFKMHKAEIDLCLWLCAKPIERSKIPVIAAIDWYWHVNPVDRTGDSRRQGIGQIDHRGGVLRIEEVLSVEVAVAKMKSELDPALVTVR